MAEDMEHAIRHRLCEEIDRAIARLQPTADPVLKQQLTGMRRARDIVRPRERDDPPDRRPVPDEWSCRCPQCTWG
ncbi:hypothetical protein G5C51_11630 [Streptomyces sp. A7024]|uniref:Uncharacterized protein n=1 Tax=Streptomyces coryli TaxID=1128680 RepID=A0A6G4TYE9_9ACTN|nr:hypothetical protein [Streptomyces coryli]NGN64550.1 hypothetical protein [Streptomyces coryli]